MIIYFSVLFISLFIGLSRGIKSSLNLYGFYAFFVLLLFLSGLRFEVGPDWSGYDNIYRQYLYVDWGGFYKIREFGFFILNKMAQSFGLGYQGVIFFSAVIFLFGFFSFARSTSNPWLALAVAMPYLFFVISMSGIRQACAIGIGFYLLSKWSRLSIVSMLVLALLAISFHTSAVILFVFLVARLNVKPIVKWALFLLVAVVLLLSLNELDALERYRTVYLKNNIISGGAFFHVLLSAFPAALYLCFRKRIDYRVGNNPSVLYGSLGALIALPLVLVSSTGVDRLALYLSFVQMWVYPALLQANIIQLSVARLVILIVVLAIFFVYFLLGTHSSAYVPYNNVLF